MSEQVVNKGKIENFVRGSLGCTCPKEVFECIKIERNPVKFANMPRGYLLSIGDKLLIYVVDVKDLALIQANLKQIFSWGCKRRDAEGFNRFRLVVTTAEIEPARQILLQQFSTLSDRDERLHLHVITSDQLPEI